MTTDIFHPDKLGPGDCVGPWKILEVLGAGGFGRIFKVEQEGRVYALKMATRLPGERVQGEEDIDGWCMREATALMERTPHPHIPRAFSVSRWPDPEAGFLFVVMEFVDGWRFHDWRYKKHPSAAQLVDVLLPLARTLAELHQRGIHHRDLNANNILIRTQDERPFVLDFGSAHLPGARTLTQGLPPIDFAVMPPEAFEHARSHGAEARFEGGELADLYAFGVLLYSALTDGYPFNPDLELEKLLAAITVRVPRAPHHLNPKVPRSLSAIAMRLLEKRPGDRFESAEALHQALWEANKERGSRAWKISLDLPESGPAPMSDEEVEEREQDEQARRARRASAQDEAPLENTVERMKEQPVAEDIFARINDSPDRRPKNGGTWARVRRPVAVVLSAALVVGIVARVWWGTTHPASSPGQEVATLVKSPDPGTAASSPDIAVDTPAVVASSATRSEDSSSVKTRTNTQPKQKAPGLRAARQVVGAAVTCSALAGCPGTQVRPLPPAEPCPEGAAETMAQLGIRRGQEHLASLDPFGGAGFITVSEGRTAAMILGRFEGLPGRTMLSGQLILADRAYGRFTTATVDGRALPVCFEAVDLDRSGRGIKREPNGSGKVYSSFHVRPVLKFE